MTVEIQFTSEAAESAYQGENYGSPDAAGFDLRAIIGEEILLRRSEQAMIPTGIKLNMAPFARQTESLKVAALAMPRSGRGSKEGLIIGNTLGLIDQDYQGEIMLCCWARPMLRSADVVIKPNERIAQLVFVPVLRPALRIVGTFSSATARGEAGFGSTGKG